jgi:hypothetical protein
MRKRFLILGFAVLLLVGTLLACGEASNASSNTNSSSSSSSSSVTPTPTKQLKWTTTHTFTGNGIKKTGTFTAPDDWKILWKCNPSSFNGLNYNVIVTVYGSDGTMQDIAINATCKPGNTSGETEEHQGGQVYLDVDSEADWTLQVQELK